MENIIAHDNAIFVDSEDKTLDKVLKQTKKDITDTATAVASSDNLANVKIGDNVNVTEDGTISIPPADNSTMGVIIPGIGLNINNETPGVLDISLGDGISSVAQQGDIYLDKATTEDIGGVIVGEGLTIDSLGVLSIASNALSFSSSDFQNSPPDINVFSTGWSGAVYKILNVSADSLHKYTQLQIETNRFLNPVCTGSENKEESSTLYKYTYNVYTDPKDSQVYVLYKKVAIDS